MFVLVRLLVCAMGLLVLPACRTGPLRPLAAAPEVATTSRSPQASPSEPALAPEPAEALVVSRAWTGPKPRADGLYAHTSPGSLPELCDAHGNPLPLRHTDVHARLRGHVAEVRVRQTFHNAAERPIEVVYSFPLPENAAVADMRMVIGERVVKSEIHERRRARATYEAARAEGHTAALLEQERPNVFTHSVANIAPGEDVDVELRYLQTLTYDAGQYELVFPMVVGPRFMPGEPTGGPQSGVGTHADTARVPDAARISPPIVGRGTRSGHDIAVAVEVDAGLPIVSWTTPTHEVDAEARDGRLRVVLAAHDTLPNRDFVLRYRVAGAAARATAFLGPRDARGNGHYLMVVVPPDVDVDAEVGRRELVFVVDRSGSMAGEPLALAKETVREMLAHLRPVDSFDIVGFAAGTERLFGRPRPANAENLVLALAFIDGMHSGGGTMMLDAVQAALADEVAAGFNRYVLFLTDGYVGNETEIFAGAEDLVARISARGQVARVFGIGIGSSVNRHLLDGLAEAGHGVARTVTLREEPALVVNATMHDIDRPALTELRLPTGSALAEESYPSVMPDLFVSHPVVVVGRYHGSPPETLHLYARLGVKTIRVPVRLRHLDEDDHTATTLWARAKIDALEAQLWHGPDANAVEQITALGLRHRIVTAYTSFVAVDRTRTVGNGRPHIVVQPTEAPEGVDVEQATGRTVSMEEFRNIPIGSTTSREFTQAVESHAVASQEPTRQILVPQLRVSASSQVRMVSSAHTEPKVRVSFGRLRSKSTRASWPLRVKLQMYRFRLQQCYEDSPAHLERERVSLLVELRIDEDGKASARIARGTLHDAAADGCITSVIARIPWELPAGAVLQLPLRLWTGS